MCRLDFVKAKLKGASDDDWKTFEPKLVKVFEARRNAQTGAGMQMMFFNGAPQARAAIDVVGAFTSDPLTAMRELKDMPPITHDDKGTKKFSMQTWPKRCERRVTRRKQSCRPRRTR